MNSLTQWLPPPDPSGPITCAACGCRLTEAYVGDRRAWQHFSSLHPDQDARGCRPRCLHVLHGRDGRALTVDGVSEAEAANIAFLATEPVSAEENAAA
jgi:transcription initiation factor TFIIIB Brf1 subunit/transcription initiation factor TFIIB